MANSITPWDAYTLINAMVEQATGRKTSAAIDTSSFVTVGETILRTGTENVLKAISTMVGRTIFSARPYRSTLSSVITSDTRWGIQTRKITPLRLAAEQSENWNTEQNPNQLADGQSVDMYKIKAPKAIQLNFYGTKLLQRHITRFQDQLSPAVTNESEFMRFWDAVMIEFANETEVENEAKTRATILNFMAGLISMNLGVIDMVADYNATYGTEYTRAELMTTYLEEFMKHVAAQIVIYSDFLKDMSVLNHANITGYEQIQRHSPKSRQKMLMYNPFFQNAKANVYSSLFNPDYLNIGDFEGVNYWQNQQERTAINVTPNILNVATGASVTASAAVTHPYVLGLLYDEEALGVNPQFSYASTTPFNSAGEYYNMYLHWRFNAYNDFTENAILFVLGDGGKPAELSDAGPANAVMKSTASRSKVNVS